MSRLRNYWIYSLGLGIAWAIVLVVVSLAKPQSEHSVVVAFLGFGIGWISTTIARYVYPPAKRWRTPTDTATKEN
jgi:Na+-transporting NADH:ubiquinone oxidoreductase subunit NqrE